MSDLEIDPTLRSHVMPNAGPITAYDMYEDEEIPDIDPKIFADSSPAKPEHWKSQNFAEFLMRSADRRFVTDEASVYENAFSDQVLELQGTDGYSYIIHKPRHFDEVVRAGLMDEFGDNFWPTITRRILVGIYEEQTEYNLVDRKIIHQTITLPQIRDKRTNGNFDKSKADKTQPQELSDHDTKDLIRIITLSKAAPRIAQANKEFRRTDSPDKAKLLGDASLRLAEVS